MGGKIGVGSSSGSGGEVNIGTSGGAGLLD